MHTVADRPIRRERTRTPSAPSPSPSVEAHVRALRDWELEHRPGVAFHPDSPEWSEYGAARGAFLDALAEEVDTPDPFALVLALVDAEHRLRSGDATDREWVASCSRWFGLLAANAPDGRGDAMRAVAAVLSQLVDLFGAFGHEDAGSLLAADPFLAVRAARASA